LPAIPRRRWRSDKKNLADTLHSNMLQSRYEEMVRQAKEYITAGDIFQVVLSQRFSRQTSAHPFAIYRALRMLNPSPYMFYFDFGPEMQVIGASPEMHVRLEDGVASVRPIAGTRPRGATPTQDNELAEELLADPKERAEHVMLVDLGRNDIGRVSEYGTVNVRDLMVVERYSHVMHIVSEVTGEVAPAHGPWDVLGATFPAGTLTGAPKVRAMQIIREIEPRPRWVYGGAIGYASPGGALDFAIAIRTVVLRDGRFEVTAGAGIVADSIPELEAKETRNKARAALAAIHAARSR
jgi:anthranilate synthase component 1